MSLSAVSNNRFRSVEEYLRLEETSAVRHEFVGGRVYALAGVTRRHNRIVLNFARHLLASVGDGPCRVSVADVRLRAPEGAFYYPDVMVACGPEPSDPYVEVAPCVVIEVTSPSTAAIDRREKLFLYRKIPSLRAYLVVDQDERRVERYWRDEAGEWFAQEILDGAVPIPCPEMEIAVEQIYRGVAQE
jgi:Uma2 family endonuclease